MCGSEGVCEGKLELEEEEGNPQLEFEVDGKVCCWFWLEFVVENRFDRGNGRKSDEDVEADVDDLVFEPDD